MKSITFASNPIDRSSKLRSDLKWQNEALKSNKSKIMVFFNDKPLIKIDPQNPSNPKIFWSKYDDIEHLIKKESLTLFLGIIEDNFYYAIDLSDLNVDQILLEPLFLNSKFIDVRTIAPSLNNKSTGVIAQAKSNFEWNKNNIYCTKCKGQVLITKESGYKKICDLCETEYFPRVDPVVIMLPYYKDRCLLGRQKIFPPNMFSALAGFVEPGETIENAVRREVYEEVGLLCKDISYKFTQPWPFPSQLMIGCLAQVENNDDEADNDEIEETVWLNKEDLTSILVGKHKKRIWIPPPMAIAHQLILEWMNNTNS
jgi:NAD+ diphosphatase